MTPGNKEQLAGTRALISCTVTGLTRKLNSVKWTTSNKVAISSGENGYIVYDGEFDSTADGSQTTILTVPDSLTNFWWHFLWKNCMHNVEFKMKIEGKHEKKAVHRVHRWTLNQIDSYMSTSHYIDTHTLPIHLYEMENLLNVFKTMTMVLFIWSILADVIKQL